VIKDVEKSLPPKNERILRLEMTPLQKQYYKWILQRNFKELNNGRAQLCCTTAAAVWMPLPCWHLATGQHDAQAMQSCVQAQHSSTSIACVSLSSAPQRCPEPPLCCLAGAKGSGQISLLNIISELKKICNHPFLFESVLEDFRGRDDSMLLERMVLTSGKMVVLDKLLRKLKATGHRVLLFSQVRPQHTCQQLYEGRGYCDCKVPCLCTACSGPCTQAPACAEAAASCCMPQRWRMDALVLTNHVVSCRWCACWTSSATTCGGRATSTSAWTAPRPQQRATRPWSTSTSRARPTSPSCCPRAQVAWASTWPPQTRSSSLTVTGTRRTICR
jgi:hypothetical protein